MTVDDLAQEIRRVDGNHNLGAGALAEALMPFLAARPVSHGEGFSALQASPSVPICATADSAGHTPGPWSRYDDGGRTASGVCYGPSYADCVWGPGGPGHGLVADCSPNALPPDARTIANARLVAAAPDLLEASRLALNALVIASRQLTEDHKMVLKGQGWAAQDIASLRAAIAKATGEEGQ
jgi:hypothetical protein